MIITKGRFHSDSGKKIDKIDFFLANMKSTKENKKIILIVFIIKVELFIPTFNQKNLDFLRFVYIIVE